jgi:hypothetical protein
MTTSEIDLLASEPQTVTLVSGTEVRVLRLKTRQLMKLMRILTTGAGSALSNVQIGEDASPEQITTQLLAMLAFSIPEAEDETIDFIWSMVEPAKLISDPKSKPEHEVNEGLLANLRAEMTNPELDDLMTVIEAVVTIEGPHLASLGKRLGALFTMAQKVSAATPAKPKRRASTKTTSAA